MSRKRGKKWRGAFRLDEPAVGTITNRRYQESRDKKKEEKSKRKLKGKEIKKGKWIVCNVGIHLPGYLKRKRERERENNTERCQWLSYRPITALPFFLLRLPQLKRSPLKRRPKVKTLSLRGIFLTFDAGTNHRFFQPPLLSPFSCYSLMGRNRRDGRERGKNEFRLWFTDVEERRRRPGTGHWLSQKRGPRRQNTIKRPDCRGLYEWKEKIPSPVVGGEGVCVTAYL